MKRTNSLVQCAHGKQNNLDLFRFIAALLVIFSHAFPLCLGMNALDPLARLTANHLSFGGLAVSVFFVYGGFLIAQSAERSKTARHYFVSRCFRIFPALWFVTLAIAFVIGPFFSELSADAYFQAPDTYLYLLNGILVLRHPLPGVFTHNLYNTTVNGALWTLPIEFLCYIACFIAYKLGFLKKERFLWSVPIMIAFYFGIPHLIGAESILNAALRPIMLFYIGMGFYVYRDFISLRIPIALLCVLIIIISVPLGFLEFSFLLCFPYVMFTFGFGCKQIWPSFTKRGEFSYGIYLWGWPIQQCLCALFQNSLTPIANFLIATPLAILMGIVSYYFIERYCNQLKAKLTRQFK